MFEIELYTSDKKQEWNTFISNSKNGTFLFDRDYMEYHSARFKDNSLMIYRKGLLYAVLPANRCDTTIWSHQGLTYGGLVMSVKSVTSEILDVWALVNSFLKKEGIERVIYKPIPYIYHQIPAQEDLYALFKLCKTNIIGRNISSTIYQNNKIKFIESRKAGIRKAKKNNITISSSLDFVSFWEILDNNLKNKYGVAPVHSLKEILYLNSLFPSNIKLYLAYKEDRVLGGTVLYITKNVVHTQYISASLEGKESGVLDLLFDFLINEEYSYMPIFDFGQSTEEGGDILNSSLIFQKEGFGARGVLYDIYEYYL